MGPISFPGLGINNIRIAPTAFHIGSWPIAWYGIIIAVGLLLAMAYGMRRAPSFGVSVDNLSDIIIFGIIFGIIGARLYYVLFYVDPATNTDPYLSEPLTIFTIWKGGLGIYGGVIAAFLSAFVVCKIKKISTGAVFDIAALGFLIGQSIGRWGNFINQEAYGYTTNLPWGMKILDPNTNQYITVHPCFLYESLWCILGFIILHTYSKHRKFNGEVFLMYIAWYAFGRFFIESLRSDSLLLGNLKISMLVAAVFFIASVSLLIYKRTSHKRTVEEASTAYQPLFEDASKAMAEEEENLKQENDAEDGSDTENADDPASSDDTAESSEKTAEDTPADKNDGSKNDAEER